MGGAPLNLGNLAEVPEVQGVYQLFYDRKLVYIGKTDADAGLKRRLERHSSKVQHRQNLTPALLSFKAVRVFVFTAMDLEAHLIEHYREVSRASWNNSGFGANDPGRNRDHTEIDPTNFDARFPIDIDRPLDGDFSGTRSAAAVAMNLKNMLPYTFRFQSSAPKSRKPHADLQSASLIISSEAATTRAITTELTRQLPSGWQATAFRSHVILYRERVDDYPAAIILARSD